LQLLSGGEKLKEYLLAHEDDIAMEQEDFGSLKACFESIFGYKATSFEDRERERKNKELKENMARPSFVIEEVLHIPLTQAQKLQADRWRFNKIEMETGSASS
jgi:hypothetical protein